MKNKFSLFIFICIFATVFLSGCGGGNSSSPSPERSVTFTAATPIATPTPTPEPADKGALITITKNDGSAVAVLAGVTDYPGGVNDLTYTAKDVIDFKNSIIDSYMWDGASVNIQDNEQITKGMIQSAVESAKNSVASDGTFIFMYSGHGTNSGDTGYLVPYDGIDDASKLISEDELRSWLSEFSSSTKKCVLIDSCYSGSFINKGLKSGGIKSKFIPVKGSSFNYKNEKFAKSIADVSNIYVMTACSGSEVGYETSVLQNGVFTYYINNGLWTGSVIGPADTNADNSIGADELASYAFPIIPVCTKYCPGQINAAPQHPQSYNNCAAAPAIKAAESVAYNKGAIITLTAPDNSVCAVLIGIADYYNCLNEDKPTYPAKDAIDLKNSLLAGVFPAGSNIAIQNNVQVTKAIIQAAIANAKSKVVNAGLFMFSFSGKGTKSGDTAYLIPYGGYDDAAKRITKDELKSWLDEFPSSIKKHIMLDSSYSGGFNIGSTDTYVMTSCSDTEIISESGALLNNVFSYYLSQELGRGILIGNADLDIDKKITADELSTDVAALVTSYSSKHPKTYKNYAGSTIKSSRLVILNQ